MTSLAGQLGGRKTVFFLLDWGRDGVSMLIKVVELFCELVFQNVSFKMLAMFLSCDGMAVLPD